MKTMKWLQLLAALVLLPVLVGLAACGGGASTSSSSGSNANAGTTAQATSTPLVALGAIKLNAHPASLDGKTVVLRWNGKPNGDKFLNRVAELLTQQVKNVKVVKMWEVDPTTAVSSDKGEVSAQFAEKIAAQKPDLVIASQCD